MPTDKEIEWTHCNNCNRPTRHRLLYVERITTDDELDRGFSVTWWDTYELLQCLGCEAVHLRHSSSFSEATDSDDELEKTVKFYPPRISRSKPEWLGSINGPFWIGESEIEQLLEEIYVALHNNSLRLAAMGVRALLEFMMIDKVGDRGSIRENIKAFFEAGYVAPVDQETFRSKLIEAGHAAMHRGYKPNATDLGTLLDLTESLIASIYVHPERTQGLEKRIPSKRGESSEQKKKSSESYD